jgi:hypothetical protein
LPLAGLLALVALYSTIKLGTGGILATGDNQAIVSTGYFLSVFFGDVLALTILIFGVVALYAYLANSRQSALALAAMILSIVGIALLLTRLGVIAYAVPAFSRSFLNGNPESIRILDYTFSGPLQTIEAMSVLLYSVAFILFGVAVWRSGVLPKWGGVLLAAHAPLVSAGPISAVSGLGAVLAIVGGGWIALSVLRGPHPRMMEAEAQQRVR